MAFRVFALSAILAGGAAAIPSWALRAQTGFEMKPGLDALVAAYPDHLARHDGTTLFWRDGTEMAVSDGEENKPFERMLRSASILDQIRMSYRRGPMAEPPGVNDDPGRIRNVAFFNKMYGNCERGEVARRLVTITWLPKTWGKPVAVTPVNDIPAKLRAVSAEIEALPAAVKRAAYPIAGVYNCRRVADTGQPSVHSYGAAIDLNTRFAHYWFWQKPRIDPIKYQNRMPLEIVAIFEKHGFIWGGKWYHYDTMHFEYRPELLR